jgi:hypothetical protein
MFSALVDSDHSSTILSPCNHPYHRHHHWRRPVLESTLDGPVPACRPASEAPLLRSDEVPTSEESFWTLANTVFRCSYQDNIGHEWRWEHSRRVHVAMEYVEREIPVGSEGGKVPAEVGIVAGEGGLVGEVFC